ncbi:Coq4 family protein [Leptolyngbya ohadii]|uniref:Coq4 family protein n=1 Tax=Leptolyngbya ohadii TaxID=1962290 RepID=UPI000B59C385|nr:Coq4 family protein [Leptolyngbya ohadii]
MKLKDRNKLQVDWISTLKGITSLLRDPGNTDSVYDVEDGLKNIKATQLAVDYVKSQPGVAELFEQRYLAPSPDLSALLQLSPDSLGYAYAKYLTDSGFDAEFYRKEVVDSDITYFFMRVRQTHDIWHILGGFSTDPLGELSLKAFELAQIRRPIAAIFVAGGLLQTLLKAPDQMGNFLEQIAIGYRMGAKAKPLLAQKWEEQWEKPLAEWRSELDVEPMTTYVP